MAICSYCSGTARVAHEVWDGSTSRTEYVGCSACGFTGIDYAATEREKAQALERKQAEQRRRQQQIDKKKGKKQQAAETSAAKPKTPAIGWFIGLAIGVAGFFVAKNQYGFTQGESLFAGGLAALIGISYWKVFLGFAILGFIVFLVIQNDMKQQSGRIDERQGVFVVSVADQKYPVAPALNRPAKWQQAA